MDTILAAGLPVLALALVLAPHLRARILLSRAKHRSLAGHARLSRVVAKLVPYYGYGEAQAFRVDGAPDAVARSRRQGFLRLAALYRERFAVSARTAATAEAGLSDLQFTGAYRVPFQFRALVREHLQSPAFLTSSRGVTVTDLDGNVAYDLSGSYGVNVFGYDFYKGCIDRGATKVRDLGPVLGAYHPLVVDNVLRLRAICGHDEVSFHMSGTEAVMQAVRLARYHTRRSHVVRFCGAYHGWWGDVQPGAGNPTPARDTYTLEEMDETTLRVLRSRRDVACVLVNPAQALHPNRAAPGDSTLVDGARSAGFDRVGYTRWLARLRDVCTERGIVLVFDEVFVGFRLAKGGAQEYFGVRADLVTYGKTLGGGLPVGVLCGRRELMKRFRDDRPADICFARGTFNSHPYVMAAMHEFLLALETPALEARYANLDATWDARLARLNERLEVAGVPVRVANLSTIWTTSFTVASRYHWMLQYYLRAEGLALSWVGTGRLLFSLDYTEHDFAEVTARFVAAAVRMRDDGWWWTPAGASNRRIRRALLREMIAHRLGLAANVSGSPAIPGRSGGRAADAAAPCDTA